MTFKSETYKSTGPTRRIEYIFQFGKDIQYSCEEGNVHLFKSKNTLQRAAVYNELQFSN